jgi:hypothetical protein
MRLGPLTLVPVLLLAPLRAQECPAIPRVLPNAALSAALDSTNCQLTDGSAYMPYRLDLPVRGQIKIDLSGAKSNLAIILRDGSGARVDSGPSIHRAIEAGSYVLLVNGQTPADLGPYTVTTAFTAEPGILCSSFPNIGRGQTVNGVLASAGCLLPDGSPYEAYSMTTDGSGTLTLTVTTQDFTPVITLRSVDGRLVNSSGTGTMSAFVSGDSRYTLVVTSADNTGAYQLTTAFQSAADQTCRSQKTITDSTSDSAAISGTSCSVTLFDGGDQLSYNYYVLTLASAGMVNLTAASGDFTATLNLLDASGNVLVSDSGGGGLDANGNVQSNVRMQLPAGTYRLQVFSDVPSGGNYSLTYTFAASNPQPCRPAAVSPGDPLTGGLSAGSCRTALGLADLYSMTLLSAGTLTVDMSSFDFDTRLVLRDAKDNLIVRNDGVDGVTAAHCAADLPAGTYTAVAAATTRAGNYRATSSFTAHDIPPCTFAQTLDLNGGYIQRLGPNSCRGANGRPVDYYTFALPVDSLALAVMTSSQLDGNLTLYDSNGNALRSDNNSYGPADPLIVQYLPAGTYKLGAREASAGPGGLYEIDLRTMAGPRPPFCTPRGSIPVGGTVTGNITYSACQYTDNSFADLYTLNLAADITLDLRLNSTDFDAYLILLDAKGNVVDEDDNSGGGTNSRITDTLPAGTYYIVAKPFGDYTQSGAYTLAANSLN